MPTHLQLSSTISRSAGTGSSHMLTSASQAVSGQGSKRYSTDGSTRRNKMGHVAPARHGTAQHHRVRRSRGEWGKTITSMTATPGHCPQAHHPLCGMWTGAHTLGSCRRSCLPHLASARQAPTAQRRELPLAPPPPGRRSPMLRRTRRGAAAAAGTRPSCLCRPRRQLAAPGPGRAAPPGTTCPARAWRGPVQHPRSGSPLQQAGKKQTKHEGTR